MLSERKRKQNWFAQIHDGKMQHNLSCKTNEKYTGFKWMSCQLMNNTFITLIRTLGTYMNIKLVIN